MPETIWLYWEGAQPAYIVLGDLSPVLDMARQYGVMSHSHAEEQRAP